jgi:Na+-transporting methylmalonyl-CoA/oxaloacetate decarboxylase gamma subunit
MKKVLLLLALSITATSCVIIRFPDTMHVDVSVPENFQKEDIEVIIDTLKSEKVQGVIQMKLEKKSSDQ